MSAMTFFSDCVGWPKHRVDDLIDMQARAREIKPDTFLAKVHYRDIRDVAKRLGYASVLPSGAHVRNVGMTLVDDYHVTYHRSSLPGPDGRRVPVYYLRHSAIEYVFAPRDFTLGA